MTKPPFERILRRYAFMRHGTLRIEIDMFVAETDLEAAIAEARRIACVAPDASCAVEFRTKPSRADRRIVQLRRESCGLRSGDEVLLVSATGGLASVWRVSQRRSRADVDAGRDVWLRGVRDGKAVRGILTRRPKGRFALVVKDDGTGAVVWRRVVDLYDGPVIDMDRVHRAPDREAEDALALVRREQVLATRRLRWAREVERDG